MRLKPQQTLEAALGHHRAGELERAVELYRELLDVAPETGAAWNFLGVALRTLGDLPSATDAGTRATKTAPQDAEVWNNLGNTYAAGGNDAQALQHYRRAVQLNPSYGESWANLGHAANRQGDRDTAKDGFYRAAQLMADHPAAQNDLGNALFGISDFDKAFGCYRRAATLDPDFFAAWNNMGNTLRHMHHLDGALEAYEHALEIDPGNGEAQNGRAQTLLLKGDYQLGWPAYEARFDKPGSPPRRALDAPEWQGGDIHGKTILLHAEQGLGDTLQFMRFCPLLADKGAKVILEVPPQMQGLDLGALKLEALCIQGELLPAFDCHAPLMSLPYILGLDRDALRAATPYIAARPHHKPSARENAPLRIGLVWAGNPDHVNDANRSLTLGALRELITMDGIQWHSLQLGAPRSEIKQLGLSAHIVDRADDISTLGDTARIMTELDLVISVDTAPAHLAGALGVPCLILLPHLPDWRWLLQHRGSIWYPSLKLYRQNHHNNWGSVITDLKGDLASLRSGTLGTPWYDL